MEVKPLVISGAFRMKMITMMRSAMSMSILPDPEGLGFLSLQWLIRLTVYLTNFLSLKVCLWAGNPGIGMESTQVTMKVSPENVGESISGRSSDSL